MPDTPNTMQLYQQLLHTLGATDQVSAMRELARLHALDLAATTEQSSAVARSGAVPADVIDALRDCAAAAEQHPLYLGDDADSMRIDEVGGDAALVTVIAQRCRNALRLLAAAPEPQGDANAELRRLCALSATVVRAAFFAAEDSEDDGSEFIRVDRQSWETLAASLDALDELPGIDDGQLRHGHATLADRIERAIGGRNER